ncbi:hypothetical protein [Rhodopila sp.]|uniref:hypothetical protein n=1 Tax=Rhodopila sp. TaxID=2480087 RepID=UPI003D0FD155
MPADIAREAPLPRVLGRPSGDAREARPLDDTPGIIPPSPDAGRAWTARLGLAADRLLNVVLFNGDDTWTVSLHAAVARVEGRRWGCIVCGLLGVLIQRRHCALTLDPNTQESTGAAIRAGLLILAVFAALGFGLRALFHLF